MFGALVCISDFHETDLSITPPESPLRPRLGAKESNSSKKIIQGDAVLALQNTSRDIEGKKKTLFFLFVLLLHFFPCILNFHLIHD